MTKPFYSKGLSLNPRRQVNASSFCFSDESVILFAVKNQAFVRVQGTFQNRHKSCAVKRLVRFFTPRSLCYSMTSFDLMTDSDLVNEV